MRAIFFLFVLVILLPSCKGTSGYTAKVVKPKYHHRWFDRKKDKKVKRTKVVRMKG